MHIEGDASRNTPAQDTFQGISLQPHVVHIRDLVTATRAQTILDYGSGKGMLYHLQPYRLEGNDETWDSVSDYWDVDYVACYDPSYAPFSTLPQGPFDGVICTDVLEHCPEEDMDWIVGELFRYANKFVFASIAGYPAMKTLPSGENAHCTVRPEAWWNELFQRHADHSGALWMVRFYERNANDQTLTVREFGSALA